MQKSIYFHLFCAGFMALAFTACGPKKPTVQELRAQKRANDSISLIQQTQSLHYYDSLLTATLPLIDPMLKAFRYEEKTAYEDHGHYVHRMLRTEQNTSRNYLQAYVSDDRVTTVKAYYYGPTAIQLESIVLGADSVKTSFHGSTHRFEAEGWHETMTLQGEDALNLLRFVDGYQDGRIRVTLVGSRGKNAFYISDNDKRALMETYQLGVMMNDIYQLEEYVRKTSLQVEKYQKRLEK